MTKYLMIGGSGRSGTTILCRSMARHPEVSDVPEWRFATDPDGVIDFYSQMKNGIQSPFHFETRLRRLEKLLDDLSKSDPVSRVVGSAQSRSLFHRRTGRAIGRRYSRINTTSHAPAFRKTSENLIRDLTQFTYPGYWVGTEFGERTTMRFGGRPLDQVRQACSRFLLDIAEDVCREQGATAHLEKNTWNILCWDVILELLPHAKLVHIVRDPSTLR